MGPQQRSTKPNPRLLSFILKSVIMALVITLFFLFVGIASIFLIHICVAGGPLHRRRRGNRFPNSGYDGVELDGGVSPDDLKKLPCFTYGVIGELVAVSPRDCAICLEALWEGDRCRSLPRCKHVFHADCVDNWLIKVSACPICRCGVEL